MPETLKTKTRSPIIKTQIMPEKLSAKKVGKNLKSRFEISLPKMMAGRLITIKVNRTDKTFGERTLRFLSIRQFKKLWVEDRRAMPKIKAQMPIYLGRK